MKCHNCESNNPEEAKFCGHCGVSLFNTCPGCGCSNSSQFRFCSNCGNRLASSQPVDALAKIQRYIPSYLVEKVRQSRGSIEGERKNVTVVFADISRFTAIAEMRDPEEISALLTICHTTLGRIVYKYEGVVDKIIGDGLMAIFGIPTHEDDPERAILAAIEMQEGIKGLAQEVGEDMDISLGISIGINTGTVIVGDVGTDLRLDYTIIGDVVNTASRLQEKAEPGEIIITEETYKRAAHCFDFCSLGEARIRGKKAPVHLYRVIRQKENPLPDRGSVRGLSFPLVGREKELDVCKKVAQRVMEGESRLLLVEGEAGLGKSRLIRELRDYAESLDMIWMEGRCISYSSSINYWVFVDALRSYFHVSGKTDRVETERRIRESRLAGKVRKEVISTIASFLSPQTRNQSYSDNLASSERKLIIFAALRDILASISRLKPLILVLEDLQWADEISIEFLLFLMKELPQNSLAVICAYRPANGDSHAFPVRILEEECCHSTSDLYARCNRIILKPLSNPESNTLIDSILASENLPIEMKYLILEKAGGNPLYLEEVIRSIIDSKAIEKRDGKWIVANEIEELEVPGTLQGVLMERIDRLGEETKRVLQCASVIGRSFEYSLLLYIESRVMGTGIPSPSEDDEPDPQNGCMQVQDTTPDIRSDMVNSMGASLLNTRLTELEELGFIDPEGNNQDAFRFRHALIQDVAYNTILKRRREEIHEAICHYFERVHSDHLHEFYEILAHHYNRSRDVESAISYLIKAGDKNRKGSKGSAESAIRYFRKALDILESCSLDRSEFYKQKIHEGMGEVCKDLGRYEEALSSFEAMLYASEQIKDYPAKAGALRQIANVKSQLGDWGLALETYRKSLDIAREMEMLPQMGYVYNGMGYGYFERGDLDKAMECFNEAASLGRQSGDFCLAGDASAGLGNIASIRHDSDAAIRYYQVSLQNYREAGESIYEAQIYQNLGITYFKMGKPDIAEVYYAKSLEISETCGYNKLIAYIYLNRAELFIYKNDLNKALDLCMRAFEIVNTLDDRLAAAEGHKYYGMIYRRQGDFGSAREAFHTSLEISREVGYMPNEAETYLEMGLMYKEEGELEKALELFNKARDSFEELCITEEVQRINDYIAELEGGYLLTKHGSYPMELS